MRLLVTSDLHYNHPRSRESADAIIRQINNAGTDVLLLIGDAAVPDADWLEKCLSRFSHPGPRLFVPGNHELWTTSGDSYEIYTTALPRRIAALGWRWLPSEPFVINCTAIVGSLGWYDYSFAVPHLGIPRRFYEHKISPGAAAHFSQYAHLLADSSDIPTHALEIFARWNDGRFVHLGRSDDQFLRETLEQLQAQLDALARTNAYTIVAAIHHLPFTELLPPSHAADWDFSKAFLGSEQIGRLLLRYPQMKHVYCGHSHFAASASVAQIHATATGSGYRHKTMHTLNLPD